MSEFDLLTNLKECLNAPVKDVLRAMAKTGASTIRLSFDTSGKPIAGIVFVTGDKTEDVLKAVDDIGDDE